MAKKTTSTTTSNTTETTINKSDEIRAVHAAHPEMKAKDIVAALKAKGIEVGLAHVASVMRPKSVKIDQEAVKLAAGFVKVYKGSIEDAAADIESVGQFIDACGGYEKAMAALTTFKDLSAMLVK
jgi:hypothetical protein